MTATSAPSMRVFEENYGITKPEHSNFPRHEYPGSQAENRP